MSMYAQYIKERENKDCIENEYGFATFKISGEICYLEDIYIDPAYRQRHEASLLANQVVERAKEKGCKFLVGTVNPATNNATISLKVLLGYDMKLDSIRDGLIWFYKEI
jgi:ribosomal protein S18 acetylase RimI-like enzyme